MKKSTLLLNKKVFKFLKFIFVLGFILFFSNSTFAHYATKHYIAPVPWNYASDANQFVVSSISVKAVSVVITKSDGTAITTLSVTSNSPNAYRLTGASGALAANTINTIYIDRGLIFISDTPLAVIIRNIESDQVNGGNYAFIKGNAAPLII